MWWKKSITAFKFTHNKIAMSQKRQFFTVYIESYIVYEVGGVMTLTMVRDTLRVLTVIFILPWTSFIVEKIFNKNLLATSTVMVIVMYVLFAGFWCGWLCPFGNLDFVITKLGDKIVPKAWRKSCVLPKKVHSYLGWLRYFFILPFVALAVSAGNIRVQQVSFWLIQLYCRFYL